MPYINQEQRDKIIINNTIKINNISSPGELNYIITYILLNYLNHNKINYTNINEVIGVLECTKLELYRRLAIPYEDKKIKENGDVY